jgi:hypothetical protein
MNNEENYLRILYVYDDYFVDYEPQPHMENYEFTEDNFQSLLATIRVLGEILRMYHIRDDEQQQEAYTYIRSRLLEKHNIPLTQEQRNIIQNSFQQYGEFDDLGAGSSAAAQNSFQAAVGQNINNNSSGMGSAAQGGRKKRKTRKAKRKAKKTRKSRK